MNSKLREAPTLRDWLTLLQTNHDKSIDEQVANIDAAEQAILALFESYASNREKLAYRNGYAAGNAKKNYRKKVDGETLEQLKTEITADVLATLRKELDREEPTHE